MLTISAPKHVTAKTSPAHYSSVVTLGVYNPNYKTDYGALPFTTANILTTEPISWSIETSWKDGAAAGVAGKLNEFMRNKFVRMMTGPELFSPVATDSWSQQVVENGSPIGIDIKFRCYYTKNPTPQNLTTCDKTYSEMIQFLTYVTQAPKKYSLGVATIGVVANMGKNLINTGEQIGTAVRGRPADVGAIQATAKYTIAAIADTAGINYIHEGSAQRGNYTLTVKIGNFGCDQLDWIVKNFTATPSMQFEPETIGAETIPMPLWVDFDVSLETNTVPSNALVSRFFSGKNLPAKRV